MLHDRHLLKYVGVVQIITHLIKSYTLLNLTERRGDQRVPGIDTQIEHIMCNNVWVRFCLIIEAYVHGIELGGYRVGQLLLCHKAQVHKILLHRGTSNEKEHTDLIGSRRGPLHASQVSYTPCNL